MEAQKTLKCPVCDWEIKDGGQKVTAGGREVVVCCDECAQKLREQGARR